MEKILVSAKLQNAKINPIEWPKVAEYVEDVIIHTVQKVAEKQGDNQYESSKDIKMQLEAVFKGNWVVIICPADQKTYNIHYTPALAPDSKY